MSPLTLKETKVEDAPLSLEEGLVELRSKPPPIEVPQTRTVVLLRQQEERGKLRYEWDPRMKECSRP